MEEAVILKGIYRFFLGLLIALFIGVGIDTFYPGPTAPEYPSQLAPYDGKTISPEQLKLQREFEAKSNQYNKELQPYNRNVSLMALSGAVLLLAASILFERRIKIIADGIMTGGLLTLVYGIGRGFASQNSKYVFVVVTVGLVVVLYLGYRHFVKRRPPTVASM